MSKAKIYIEHNGKTYRVGKSCGCASKRDCDLYDRERCNHGCDFPCNAIYDAFYEICEGVPKRCFKEVRQ